MTKVRSPSTYADAVTRIAGHVGWQAMAEAVGKTERAVRNWSDPDVDRAPSIDDCEHLDRLYLKAGGGEAPLLAVYRLHVGEGSPLSVDHAVLQAGATTLATEAGQGMAAVIPAIASNATPADRAKAAKELGEMIEAAQKMLRHLSDGDVVSFRGRA